MTTLKRLVAATCLELSLHHSSSRVYYSCTSVQLKQSHVDFVHYVTLFCTQCTVAHSPAAAMNSPEGETSHVRHDLLC